jgi:hypothetical protein
MPFGFQIENNLLSDSLKALCIGVSRIKNYIEVHAVKPLGQKKESLLLLIAQP